MNVKTGAASFMIEGDLERIEEGGLEIGDYSKRKIEEQVQ